MWNRRRIWLLLTALICVALAIYFEPTHCVRGWLWGEAFFDGRPTSYWRSELQRWDFDVHPDGGIDVRSRTPTWMDHVSAQYLRNDVAFHEDEVFPGLFFFGNDDEIPVLRELSADRCLRIREFARIGLSKTQ